MRTQSTSTAVGVQSWSLRHFKDNAQVAQMVRSIGVDQIELCDVHADFTRPAEFARIVKTYADAGVRIVSIGVVTLNGLSVEESYFQCAAAAGAKHLSVHFKVDTYQSAIPAAVRWCEKYGIRLGIHCHGGYAFGGSPDVLEHLLRLGGPSVGLTLDTAWCMQLGPRFGDPVKWVERFKGGIYGVHYKDFMFDTRAMWRDVIVGTGNLNLPSFVRALETTGFDGMSVIEYSGDETAPLAALRECVQRVRSAGVGSPAEGVPVSALATCTAG